MEKIFSGSFLFVIVASFLVSCTQEIIEGPYSIDSYLTFAPSIANVNDNFVAPETKAMEIKSSDGSISLPLESIVANGIGDEIFTDSLRTKGTQYNELPQLDSLHTFKVVGWSSNNYKFIPSDESADTTVKYNSKLNKWELQDIIPVWKNGETKTFFAYANLPTGATVTCTSDQFQTFTYPELPANAADQKDVLLGYYKGNGDGNGDGKAEGVAKIDFIHPLTAVVFKKGDTLEDITVKSISIEGVYSRGEAKVSYSYDSENNLLPSFDWGDSRGDTDTTTVSQEITNSDALIASDKFIGEPFILIPQSLYDHEIIIKAVIKTDEGDKKISVDINVGEWLSGKTNIYTLGYDTSTYDYTFTKDTTLVIQGTDAASKTVILKSTKNNKTSGIEVNVDWYIKSINFDDGNIVTVDNESYSDETGFCVKNESGNLSISMPIRENTAPGTNTYWRGKHGRWSPESWIEKDVIDLSKMDFSKDKYEEAVNAHNMTTANCYIIRHAGTYKFPLVYGNGIVDGQINERAYNPFSTGYISAKDATNTLTEFHNHLGNGITDPFIEKNEGVNIASYEILWQDQANIVTIDGIVPETVKLDGREEDVSVSYLYFTIPQNAICQNNALLCVRDTEGRIVWSWHIWTTNDPALISEPIKVTNYSGKTYEFFPPFSIGWVENIEKNKYYEKQDYTVNLVQEFSGREVKVRVYRPLVHYEYTCGVWFQHGRKDPMCTKDKPATGSFNICYSNKMQGEPDVTVSLAESIMNPNTFYSYRPDSTVTYWSKEIYLNLWTGVKSVGADRNLGKVYKTVYDPSPIGYMVPKYDAHTGFTYDGINYTTKDYNKKVDAGEDPLDLFNVNKEIGYQDGWEYYTVPVKDVKKGETPGIFFPSYVGYRGADGKITNHDSSSRFWMSSTRSGGGERHGYYFNTFHTQTLVHGGNGQAQAFSVRPIKEE